MSKIIKYGAFPALITVALIATFFISPFVQAFNTHSIDLERSSSQNLSISDGSQTGLDITGDMTVEAWVKLESFGSGEFHAVVAKDDGQPERSYAFSLLNASGTHKACMYNSSDGTNTNTTSNLCVDTGTLSIGTWYHVAWVFDSSGGEVEVFLDGVSKGSVNGLNTSNYNSSANFTIGTMGGSSYFDGLIDDVRIWDLQRTSTEIGDDKGRELNGNETGLVGYWKLNNSLDDASSNNNDLTNNGSAAHSTDTPFASFTEDLAVRKTSNESVTSSTVLQNDDQLKLSLEASTTYVIDGVLFVSASNATPDIKIALFGQSGSDITIAYHHDNNDAVLASGQTSNTIPVPNGTIAIKLSGSIATGSAGDLQLKWAQAVSNANAVTVLKGSYLRAEEI